MLTKENRHKWEPALKEWVKMPDQKALRMKKFEERKKKKAAS